MKKKWTQKEIDNLLFFFPTSTKDFLLNLFPDKSYNAIKMKAKKLKIKRNKETTKKIKSINVSGERNPMFGKIGINKNKKFSEETKKLISKSLKGRKGLSGNKNPMFGKTPYNKGIQVTDEMRLYLSTKAKERWKSLTKDEKEIFLNKLKNTRKNFLKTKKETKPERIIREMLENNKIKHEPQKEIGLYFCDFVINDNIVIEVNGDYWHGNPKIYKKEDLNLTQKNNIKRDKKKKIFLEKLGYSVFYFWEKDIIKNNFLIENKIKEIFSC
jgi:very-short-patch-repair endonuclease